jgi:hypothetical protein
VRDGVEEVKGLLMVVRDLRGLVLAFINEVRSTAFRSCTPGGVWKRREWGWFRLLASACH